MFKIVNKKKKPLTIGGNELLFIDSQVAENFLIKNGYKPFTYEKGKRNGLTEFRLFNDGKIWRYYIEEA